jgi:hypothetical protein
VLQVSRQQLLLEQKQLLLRCRRMLRLLMKMLLQLLLLLLLLELLLLLLLLLKLLQEKMLLVLVLVLLLLHGFASPVLSGSLHRKQQLLKCVVLGELMRIMLCQRALLVLPVRHRACGRSQSSTRELARLQLQALVGARTPLLLHLHQQFLKRDSPVTAGAAGRLQRTGALEGSQLRDIGHRVLASVGTSGRTVLLSRSLSPQPKGRQKRF